jgi:hypothetical protein
MGQTKLMRDRVKHNNLKTLLKKKRRELMRNAYIQSKLNKQIANNYTVVENKVIYMSKKGRVSALILNKEDLEMCQDVIDKERKRLEEKSQIKE